MVQQLREFLIKHSRTLCTLIIIIPTIVAQVKGVETYTSLAKETK